MSVLISEDELARIAADIMALPHAPDQKQAISSIMAALMALPQLPDAPEHPGQRLCPACNEKYNAAEDFWLVLDRWDTEKGRSCKLQKQP